jgi:hypothetical protein
MDLMTTTSNPPPEWVPKELLLEDFKQQCTNLQGQYARMHNRLQLLVGLNTALLPALGAVLAASAKGGIDRRWLILFPCAGLLLSLIGYITGAADRNLVTIYRDQLALTAKLVGSEYAENQPFKYEHWLHIGRSPKDVSEYLTMGRQKSLPWWDRVTSWRWEPLSVTRLPAVLSVVLFVIWAVLLGLLVCNI